MADNKIEKKKEELTVTDIVQKRVEALMATGELRLPENYSPENALKFAWLVLKETVDKNKKPVLEVCTRESIIESLFRMVISGLSVAKHQCAFIARGNKLTCMPQYQGNIALARRQAGLDRLYGYVVYADDDFEYEYHQESGQFSVTRHKTSLSHMDSNKIVGAYAVLHFNDGKPAHYEVMPMSDIRQAWEQGDTNGNSPAHKKFPGEMAKRTVINRGLKLYIQSSDDSDLADSEDSHTDIAPPVAYDAEVISFDKEDKKPKAIEAPKQVAKPQKKEAGKVPVDDVDWAGQDEPSIFDQEAEF